MATDRNLAYTVTVNDNGTAVIKNFKGQVIKGAVAVDDLDKELLQLNKTLGANTNKFKETEKALIKAKNAAIVGSAEYKKLSRDIIALKNNQQQLIGGKDSGLRGVSAASGSADASLLEVGRTISDSNYGIRGMANNLSQLASNLIYTTKKAGGLAGGLKALWGSLAGPLGVIIVFQSAIALLERWSINSEKAASATKNLKKETEGAWSGVAGSIESATAKLETYAKVFKDSTSSINAQKNALKELKSLGFDPATDSINNFIEKQKELIIVKATSGVFKKELETLVKARVTSDELIIKANQKLIDANKEVADSNNEAYGLGKVKLDREEALQSQKTAIAEVTRLTELRGNIFLNIKDKAEDYKKTIEDILDLELGKTKGRKGGKDKKDKRVGPFYDEGLQKRIEGYIAYYKKYKDLEEITALETREVAIDNMISLYDEQKIARDAEAIRLEEDRLAKVERDAAAAKEGSIERLELEALASQMRMDLQTQELDHEIMIIDAKKNAQMEYVGYMSQIGGILSSIAGENKALAIASLLVTKGAAVAQVVIASNASIASQTAATQAAIAQEAVNAAIMGPIGSVYLAAKTGLLQGQLATGITATKTASTISIASILASSISSFGSVGGGGGSKGGGAAGGGGRTFDFNLAGSTGQNQLAQTIGGQVQQPIKAYVVSSEITNQQQFDNQIQGEVTIG